MFRGACPVRRGDRQKSAPFLATPVLATPALAQGQRPLRFIPQANLSVLDPVWTTAITVYIFAADEASGIPKS
jgi:hypothetical protein